MFNNKSRNIIINRSRQRTTEAENETVCRLADYYVRVVAGTLDNMHITNDQKSEALASVRTEYSDIRRADRRDCVNMVS